MCACKREGGHGGGGEREERKKEREKERERVLSMRMSRVDGDCVMRGESSLR